MAPALLRGFVAGAARRQVARTIHLHGLGRHALEEQRAFARADLTGASLTGADLTGVNLTWADLSGANLPRAYLLEANLTRAKLQGTKLTFP